MRTWTQRRRRPRRQQPQSAAEVEALVAAVPFWWHTIELPFGVATPGHKTRAQLESELDHLDLPPLDGRSVLDIGCWDGYFAFAAERLGAARVVAMDFYTWSLDLGRQQRLYRDYLAKGEPPPPFESIDALWRPRELPGKAGFDLVKGLLQSRVEDVVDDFMSADLDRLGTFDFTLFLGLLYHMRHPLLALERLAKVTTGSAFLETHAVVVPGRPDAALCEFYEGSELSGDPTNWWGPTPAAVLGLCRAAGFRHAELLNDPPNEGYCRLLVRATK